MAQNDTSLPPKVRKSWQNSSTEAHSVNMDPTAEHQWCPEIVDIMARHLRTSLSGMMRMELIYRMVSSFLQMTQTESDNANTHYYATKKNRNRAITYILLQCAALTFLIIPNHEGCCEEQRLKWVGRDRRATTLQFHLDRGRVSPEVVPACLQ